MDERELIFVAILDCEHPAPGFPVLELAQRWIIRHAEEHHPEWVEYLRLRELNGTLGDTPAWACAALDAAKATFTDEDTLESRVERSKAAVRAAASPQLSPCSKSFENAGRGVGAAEGANNAKRAKKSR